MQTRRSIRGLTHDTSSAPSISTSCPSAMSVVASATPTTVGMPSSRPMIAVCDRMLPRSTTSPAGWHHQEHPARIGHRRDQDLAADIEMLFGSPDDARACLHAAGAAGDALKLASVRGCRRAAPVPRPSRATGQHDATRRDARRGSRLPEDVVLALALGDERSQIARDRRAAHRARDLLDRQIEHVVRLIDQARPRQPLAECPHDALDHAEGPAPHQAAGSRGARPCAASAQDQPEDRAANRMTRKPGGDRVFRPAADVRSTPGTSPWRHARSRSFRRSPA